MSDPLLDRTRRGVLLVHDFATLVAPVGARERLREERRSHLVESARAGTPCWIDLAAAARGVVDDLRLAAAYRSLAGEPRLFVAVFTDSTVSLVACGVLLAVMLPGVFLPGWFFTIVVRRSALGAASVVLFGGYLVRFCRDVRARGRSRSRTG